MAKRNFPPGETEFVTHVVKRVDEINRRPGLSQYERLHSLAFGILSALDGCSVDLPGYAVRPLKEKGKPGPDIAGGLHERFTALAEMAGIKNGSEAPRCACDYVSPLGRGGKKAREPISSGPVPKPQQPARMTTQRRSDGALKR